MYIAPHGPSKSVSLTVCQVLPRRAREPSVRLRYTDSDERRRNRRAPAILKGANIKMIVLAESFGPEPCSVQDSLPHADNRTEGAVRATQGHVKIVDGAHRDQRDLHVQPPKPRHGLSPRCP